MLKLFQTAAAEIGQKEISGAVDNPRIVQYAQEAGFSYINDDETPWCSIFANWCARQHGLERSDKLTARSWLKVGEAVDVLEVRKGDIAVFWREHPDSWKGHVGFFDSWGKGVVNVLGGNQSNQVKVSPYLQERLLGFRRLRKLQDVIPYAEQIAMQRGVINRFLSDKSKGGEMKMDGYPVLYWQDGNYRTGWLQDAESAVEGNVHTLIVVILDSDREEVIHKKKTCVAAPDCAVDWDVVPCAWDINF